MVNRRILWKKKYTNVFTVDFSCAWKVIKFIWVFCICFALIIGCGAEDLDDDDNILDNPADLLAKLPDLDNLEVREQILMEAIDEGDLQTRQSPSGEELFYAPNQEKPYTGWVKGEQKNYSDGTYWYNGLWQVQDGKRHGIYLEWYSNQQNEVKGFYKDGVIDGLWAFWYENGQKSREGTYKDGDGDGLWAFWKEDGQKHNGLIHDSAKEVAFSPDGQILASASSRYDSANIRLWDVKTWTIKHTLSGHTKSISNIAFSPDGQTLASGSWDGTIRVWNVETGTHKHTLMMNETTLSVAFSPDGQTLAGGGGDRVGIIGLWDVATGTHRHSFAGHTRQVLSVAFSPDGKTFASGSSDWTIRLWDVDEGFLLSATLRGHRAFVNSVAFSPDGKTLASGSADKTICFWNVATSKHIRAFFSPNQVECVAFSPDGKTFASGGDYDRRRQGSPILILWDMTTGLVKTELLENTNVHSVAFSPDGKTLASAESGTIRLWDIP